jgi:hypothetical protein
MRHLAEVHNVVSEQRLDVLGEEAVLVIFPHLGRDQQPAARTPHRPGGMIDTLFGDDAAEKQEIDVDGHLSHRHGFAPSAAGKADRMVQGACSGESASSATAQASIASATSTQRFTLTTRYTHIPRVLLASHATDTVETGSPPAPCITSTRAAAARRLGGFL